ncbi:aldo-keto reductase family 1 member B1-like isoform X1 [Centruroides vittatus]|uniref:aldo-keto reductase family 1 member B1-like isoform X1 n=1 Tax=Centruroides vittatus TaxID=120091 RepID=UPI00350F9D53
MATRVLRVQLSNGYKIPAIGLGTWKSKLGEGKQAVKDAIELGYRHIDCALYYENEEEIGEAIKEKIDDGTVKREELFITSKCWNTYHSKDKVVECCQKSLKALKLDYLDLFLIHWPMGYKEGGDLLPTDANGHFLFSDVDYLETWMGMEECHKRGYVRSIGISNFNISQIKRLWENAIIKPVMNQVESHPYLNQFELLEFCNRLNVKITAYCPLGAPYQYGSKPGEKNLLEDPILKEIASNYSKTTAQVALRYQIQRGVIVVPKSSNKERLKSNIEIFDFKLSRDEMKAIEALNCNIRIVTMIHSKSHPYYPF